MSKKTDQTKLPNDGDQRLVVWGERRKEPDWDTFIAALIAFALREVEEQDASTPKETDA